MAQVNGLPPLTVERRVRSQVSPCNIYDTMWNWDRFVSEFFGLPLSLSFYKCSVFTSYSSTTDDIILETDQPLSKISACHTYDPHR